MKKSQLINKVIFDPKMKFLAHSEKFRFSKNPFFALFSATLGQIYPKIVGKFIKTTDLLQTFQKICTMGRFLQKCSTEYFLMCHFGMSLRCPQMPHH
jgi:hypothetical protein